MLFGKFGVVEGFGEAREAGGHTVVSVALKLRGEDAKTRSRGT